MVTRIPSEYQEVEYLESDGAGSYINSGIECTSDLVIDFGFSVSSYVNFAICGGINASESPTYFRHHASPQVNGGLYWIQHDTASLPAINKGVLLNKKYELTIDPVLCICKLSGNGKILYTGSFLQIDGYYTTGKSYGIMGRISNTGEVQSRPNRCYYFRFYKNNVLVGNFIPCYRKSDNKPGMYDTVSKTFYTNSGTGEFLVGNDVYYDTTNLLESRRRILLTTPHLESPTPANPLTFKTNMTTKLKEGKVYFTPIQEGEGDPSPDNVRPISGWDGISVTKCGKNLLGGDKLADFLFPNGDYVIHSDGNGRYIEWRNIRHSFVPFPSGMIKDNRRYTFIAKVNSTGDTNVFILFYTDSSYANWTTTTGLNTKKYLTATNKTISGLRLQQRSATIKLYIDESGLFEDNIDITSYEPYTETKITISFPQTIYGGYVDLVNGEVVEEYTAVTLDGENVKCNYGQYPSTYYYGAGWAYAEPAGKGYDVPSALSRYMCDILPNASVSTTVPHYAIPRNGKLYYMIKVLPKSDYPDGLTDEEVRDLTNEWLKVNPTTFAYPLATPIHHTIDPHILTTLRGANTIWSNSNSDVEITYWKHNDDAYQHVPSSPILSNDNFIIVTDDGYAIGEEDDFIVY